MRKNAFTIVEIVIVIFLLLVVASIFVPMNIANVAQAQRIAKWKNILEETKYSLEVLKVQKPKMFEEMATLGPTDSAQSFKIIKKYINVKEDAQTKKSLKHYKYKFLNGRKVRPSSHFYVKDFAMLESGVIIGFRLNKDRAFSGARPVGVMIFDVNGLEKPNKLGKDVFGVNIYQDSLKPFGEGKSNSVLRANCSPVGTGVMCSKYYLIGGNF